MPCITRKKARYLYNDERKAAKEYHRLGYHEFAEDEERHARYFKGRLKKMKTSKLAKKLRIKPKRLTGIERGTISMFKKRKRY